MDGSWWRELTECGPLENGMANHFSILALRITWTVWKGTVIGYWKRNSPGRSVQSVHSLSHVQLFATPWIAARQASLSTTNSQNLLKLMPIQSVMPSKHLILCPLLLLPPIPPSITVFSNESTLCMRLSKYWSFSFSISPSSEHSGLISFRMDCLVLLAAQWSLKSLLQHNSSKASMFWCSAFFTVQLAHPYMTTGKTKALTRQTFVGEVMSLCFNMLSRLVITFLPRSKCLLISWLQSWSTVILEPPKNKVWHLFPQYLHHPLSKGRNKVQIVYKVHATKRILLSFSH